MLSSPADTGEVWPAFTDVMSTMAIVLFVLVLLAYVRNLVASKQLAALQRQIDVSARQLTALDAEIKAGRAALAASQARLRDQQLVLDDSNRQLDTLRLQLQSIAVLRVSVLDKVKQAIEAELGPRTADGAALVSIGNNGNVVVNESVVFEYGSYAIKKEAKPLLDTLARALGKVLGDADIRTNVDTILIQGHTDERGSTSYNWELSAKRATAVLDYLFEANKTLAESYGSYFAASAYSKFRPIDPAKGEDAYQKNRRIEISVIPKDDNVRKVIEDYTRAVTPPPPAPTRP